MKLSPRKIACIFAHPDDEAFGPGGAIAYFAAHGVEITLICVTDGSSFGDKKLGKERNQELLISSEILGIKKVIFLNFKDGNLNNNNYHEVTKQLKFHLDKIKPDTILTFDQNGVSGHIDHIAVSLECSFLFERLNYIRTILYYREKKEVKKFIGKKYFIYFPDGFERKEADLVINTEKYFEIQKKSMLSHKSQRKDALMILTFLRKFKKEEYFKVLTK